MSTINYTQIGNTKSLSVPEFLNKSEIEISKLALELCKEPSKWESIDDILPCCAQLIKSNNQNVQENILWALSHASEGSDDRIKAVMNTGVTPFLIFLLGSKSDRIVLPALRALGNLVSGDDLQTQVVINENVLSPVATLLYHSNLEIRKQSCWLLSNIAAGNSSQKSALMSQPGLMTTIIALAMSAEWVVRKEAAWTISNICYRCSQAHNRQLCNLGAIGALFSLLDGNDPNILIIALEAIESILRSGQQPGIVYDLAAKCNGIDKIEKLIGHANYNVRRKACRLGVEGAFLCRKTDIVEIEAQVRSLCIRI